MDWKVRFKVAVGIAEGLRYLHHECHRRIIHRDIKASNILLTEDYEAQVLLLFFKSVFSYNLFLMDFLNIEGVLFYCCCRYLILD